MYWHLICAFNCFCNVCSTASVSTVVSILMQEAIHNYDHSVMFRTTDYSAGSKLRHTAHEEGSGVEPWRCPNYLGFAPRVQQPRRSDSKRCGTRLQGGAILTVWVKVMPRSSYRLLRVASTQQLKLLCGESERNVGETAELYLEVAPTCPLFYAQ